LTTTTTSTTTTTTTTMDESNIQLKDSLSVSLNLSNLTPCIDELEKRMAVEARFQGTARWQAAALGASKEERRGTPLLSGGELQGRMLCLTGILVVHINNINNFGSGVG
jgi:hypothetical protein